MFIENQQTPREYRCDCDTPEKELYWSFISFVLRSSRVPQSTFVEMQVTKERFRKTGGTRFCRFVRS